MHCILQNRITFAGCEGYEYIYIKVKGKSITANSISSQEAREIIDSENLQYARPETYENYDYRLGNIYTSPNFKSYVNKHKKVKKNLFTVLEQLDNS